MSSERLPPHLDVLGTRQAVGEMAIQDVLNLTGGQGQGWRLIAAMVAEGKASIWMTGSSREGEGRWLASWEVKPRGLLIAPTVIGECFEPSVRADLAILAGSGPYRPFLFASPSGILRAAIPFLSPILEKRI